MDWLKEVNNILNNQTVAGLVNKKPSAPPPVSMPVIQVDNPMMGMDNKTMLMIGGGILAVIAVLFLAFKK